jgi:hypothetical protein
MEQHANIKFSFKHGKIAAATSKIFETVNGNEGLPRMVENIQRGD